MHGYSTECPGAERWETVIRRPAVIHRILLKELPFGDQKCCSGSVLC